MLPRIFLEPIEDHSFEQIKIKQQLNADVRSAYFLENSASLAQAVFDDSPKEFVEYPEMTMEEAFGMKVQSPEDAASFSDEES